MHVYHAPPTVWNAPVQLSASNAKITMISQTMLVLADLKELAKLLKSVELLSNVQLVALDAQMLLPAQGV